MRIITGKFKGAKLYTVDGLTTRPTTDFNREVIFSMYPDYQSLRVLDCFAGTGSFGLEALSRGADWVDFVEFATPAIAVLLQNIQKLRCNDVCHVYRKRVEQYLKSSSEPYDVIFLDPPYNKNVVGKCLELIFGKPAETVDDALDSAASACCSTGLLKADSIVIVEHSSRELIADKWQAHVLNHKAGKITSFTVLQTPAATL